MRVRHRSARDDGTSVRQADAPSRPAWAVDPAAALAQRPGQRLAGARDQRTIGAVEREAEVEPLRQPLDCLALHGRRRVRRRQRRGRELSRQLARLAGRRGVETDPPEGTGHGHHHQQTDDDRKIDFLIEPSHRKLSSDPWRTRSRRRAP